MSKISFLFPGQGSQYVGMGKDLSQSSSIAAKVFDEANEIMKFDLASLCWEGPEEHLNQTEFTQPAILAVSIAVLEVLKERGIRAEIVAGHSLGEYTALVAAGTLSLSQALTLVRSRGRYMQEAVKFGTGAMSAVLGLSQNEVRAVCDKAGEKGIVTLANLNSPLQIVISGEKEAVEYASELAREAGAKRVKLLPVSVPSHCSLMEPAARRLSTELDDLTLYDPKIPVVTNVDAKMITKAEEVRHSLVRQLSSPVRWVDSVLCLKEYGVDCCVEVGPGRVLSGLLKRTASEIKSFHVEDAESLNRTVENLTSKV